MIVKSEKFIIQDLKIDHNDEKIEDIKGAVKLTLE